MQIKIISVENQKVKTYFQLNVVYESQYGNKTFKLFSFANPATFAVLKDAQPGEQYEITTGKNDKDYTTWTQAVKVASSGTPNTGTAPAATKAAWVPDADRQRLIVKQSSVTAALKFLELTNVAPVNVESVTELADEFVKYVYDVPTLETETE